MKCKLSIFSGAITLALLAGCELVVDDGTRVLASTDAETKPLEDAVAVDGNTATKTLLGEFTVSRMIYRLNAQGSPDSNRLRAELIWRPRPDAVPARDLRPCREARRPDQA